MSERKNSPEEETVVGALKAWCVANGVEWTGSFDAFWRIFTGLPVKDAKYSSYYGTKEVWTVVLQHPDHKPAPRGARRPR